MISAGRLSEALGLPPPTEEQAAVIEAPLTPALVVAGAGSGKTETMAARVLYLVANDLVRPDEVLGLTFTRKAASGLAARIRRRLRMLAVAGLTAGTPDAGANRPCDGGGEPEVSTYHSFGGRLISEFGPLAGVELAARVLSTTGSWQLARRVVGRWDGDLATDLGPDQVTERLLAMAGGLADHLIDVGTLTDEIESVLARLRAAPPSPAQRGPVHSNLIGPVKRLQDRAWILPLVEAFTDAKRRNGVVDFADQMQVAAALVTGHPRIGETLRSRHRVVLLDEYQDTGHAQRVILRAAFAQLATGARPSGHPVTAVGDPVQSIYSWRGAAPSNLPRFPTDFPDRSGRPAHTLTLSTSFRNASAILQVANDISAPVRSGRVRVPELRARVGAPPGCVRLGLFDTVIAEEAWIAEQIAVQWTRAGWPVGTSDRIDSDPSGPSGPSGDVSPRGGAEPAGELPPSTAVLMRRRRDMEPMAVALRAVGLPVEVVGLGGLLSEPEIADLLALLQVLVNPAAGPAAVRLLTGARWQLGMADLAALASRASTLTPRRSGESADGGQGDAGRAAVRDALDGAGSGEEIDAASLVDAISDPGPGEAYSGPGLRRIQRLGTELRRLRSKLSLPLPDLLAELERTTGLDVEVQISSVAGRAHLDAFADVVAEFAVGGGGPTELVEYLLTAAEREDGLAPGDVPPAPGRVQILTVHAAKGLEWEIVAVPQLADTVFPSSRSSTWLGDAAQLPPAVRGDRDDLPQLILPVGGNQKEMVEALASHTADLKADQAVEERRLLYVAVTRAERVLFVSGHHWGRTGAKPHGASEFLTEIRQAAAVHRTPDEWASTPEDGASNPLTSEPRRIQWPVDPLGRRRGPIEQGARLVKIALAERTRMDRLLGTAPERTGVPAADRDASSAAVTVEGPSGGADSWARDVAALLTERQALRSRSFEVALPQSMSATSLVDLADDPAALARRIRRPVPHAPTPRARRGTALHGWLERHFTSSALVEINDLPGAEVGLVPDAQLEELKVKFLASSWSRRVPFEVELPFSMTIGGQPVKGRVDAVFRDADGGCTVVDWKTGRPPAPGRRAAATIQLAVYRLAVAQILGCPLTEVRAAFVYIGLDETFGPADLLDAGGLAALVRDSTSAPGMAAEPGAPTRSAGDTHVGADVGSGVDFGSGPEPPPDFEPRLISSPRRTSLRNAAPQGRRN